MQVCVRPTHIDRNKAVMLADQGITCSMSRRGECWDNAAMESFLSTLKIERVFRSKYKTWDEARGRYF